jgi:GAF domain-containing protein/HAMP domain-containing protein
MPKDVKSTKSKSNRLRRRLFGAFIVAAFVPLSVMILLIAVFYLQVVRGAALSQLNTVAPAQLLLGIVLLLLVLMLVIWFAYRISRNIAYPVAVTVSAIRQFEAGDLQAELPTSNRKDEIGDLTKSFNEMRIQLQTKMDELSEQAANDRHALKKNSASLLVFADVNQVVSSALNSDEICNNLVELIRKKFDYTYVGLFLTDEDNKWAMLTAASSANGEVTPAGAQRLLIDEDTLIGWVIANSRERVASETNENGLQSTDPELPDSRFDAVLPMRSRGTVIGALSIQSWLPDAFEPDSLAILQALADQAAIAIDNARLFAEIRLALENADLAYGEISHSGWLKLLHNKSGIAYQGTSIGIEAVSPSREAYVAQAIENKQTVAGVESSEDGLYPLAVPIQAGGLVLGTINTYKPGEIGPWSPDEILLLENIADQLGLALESSRLFEQSQRRAEYEKITSQVSANIRERMEIEAVLRTAAQEVRKAMGLPEVTVRLTAPTGKRVD